MGPVHHAQWSPESRYKSRGPCPLLHLWIHIHEDAKDAFANFDGAGLCAYFGRHCCLHAGFWGLNGASIMASSVLMSRDLLHWLSSPSPGLSSPTLLYTLWSHWSFLLAHFFHIFIQGFPAFLEPTCLMSPSTHLWMFLPVTVLELKASAKALPQCNMSFMETNPCSHAWLLMFGLE